MDRDRAHGCVETLDDMGVLKMDHLAIVSLILLLLVAWVVIVYGKPME